MKGTLDVAQACARITAYLDRREAHRLPAYTVIASYDDGAVALRADDLRLLVAAVSRD